MSLKTILNKQTDFTGEFPAEYAASGLWRFNESAPDENTSLLDESGCGRNFTIVNWSGTTANLKSSPKGRQIRFNINNPTSEKTHLQVTNDGSIFANLGERIIVGGWMNPTTYSVGNTFCPIFNTRYGPGQPIFYSASYAKTTKADLRTNPNVYTIEMRKRGNKVRVYSSTSYTLRFTATISSGGGYAGIRSEKPVNCQLLRLGDAWTYEPYERFDVIMLDGTETSYGRIDRSDCTWDEEFQVFTLTSDVEEYSTRSEEISLDYEFYHSHMMPLECGNDYTAKIIPRDINIWISRLFLGDSDGFSILYYQDVDSLIYWANQAAYRWKLRGMCMWSLGQEDMRVWEWLPKQTE